MPISYLYGPPPEEYYEDQQQQQQQQDLEGQQQQQPPPGFVPFLDSEGQFGSLPDQQAAAPVTVQPEYDAAALADHAPERVDDAAAAAASSMPAGAAFQAAAAAAAAISNGNGNNSTSAATREIVIRLPPRYVSGFLLVFGATHT